MKKVNRSIWCIAALLLLSAFLFFGLTIQNNRRMQSTSDWVTHTYNVIKKIKEIQSSVSVSEAALKGHILQQDLESGIEIQQIHRKLSAQIKELQELTKDNPVQQQNISKLSGLSAEKINFENSILRLPQSEQLDKAGSNEKEQHANKFINEILDTITQVENSLLRERVAESESTRLKNLYTTLGSGFIALCILLWILYKITLENRKRIVAQEEANKNELKYKKLVEDASVIMYTANTQGKFTYASNKCFNLTGYTNNEILGMHFTELIHKDWIQEIADQYHFQFNNNISETTLEFLINTKDNSEKWVEQVAAIVYENGYPAGFQCIVKDITDRKTAEQALQKKEHEIQTVLNNTREGFFVIDRDYRIQILNKKATEQIEMISGKKPSAGINFLSVVADGDKERAKENFDLVFRGEIVDFEFRYETTEGPVWSRISHSPIKNADGTIAGAAVITHDITQAKIAEEQIIAANEKIGAMLASTQEGFFMFDKHNIITMINEAGKKQVKIFTGRECNIGDNILQHIVPERQDVFKKIIQKILAGDTKETEVQLMTDEGEIWVQNNYFPVYDKNNEIIGVCASSKDITSHKLAEKKLEKIRAEKDEYQFRLQSILDNTPLSIFVKDLQGRYTIVNKSFRSTVGLTDDKIIGKTDFDFTNKQDAERYKKADDLVIETLQDIETEETLYTENGKQHLLIVKFPLLDKKHTLYGIGAIAADITERTAYQQKIVDAMKKAERAEQLQEEFLANMSHEIRTPMNGIIGMTNLLKNTRLDEEQKEFVHIISQSSDNLLVLMNDILDLSKIKAGKVSIESIPFSLRETLETVINPFRIKAKEKALELLMQHDLTVPDNLTGDPYRLTQILSNLLSNAVKFTNSGFIKLSVRQQLQKENEITLVFSVSDSGIGIPAENLDMIFENFQQAHTDTTRKFGGTGLGLSITKKLVKLQQGNISVSSKENEGATFTVVLNYSVNKETGQFEKTFINILPGADNILSGKKVLIAEDNHINQKILVSLLKKWDMQIKIANNGREAIEALQKDSNFHFILMDLQMPEMDGFQTAAFVRNKLSLNIPIIAMTASVMRGEKEKCLSVGINEFITKPFSSAKLTDILQCLLVDNADSKKNEENIFSINKPGGNTTYSLRYLYEVGDDEYCSGVLEMFLKDTPPMLKAIREAAFCEQWDEVHKKAHKLKSSLGVMQMQQILDLMNQVECKVIERYALGTITSDVDKAVELFRITQPMIQADLNNIKQATA